ncbi:MAG TPA: hypothetical protein PLI12_08625 [Acetobacteraceae bacterium]|jgi:hypothetical protein|nr:hypothetical protein [Acetobacteraceae bacterium]HQU02498.1 hypothetical protein [Acetobacteraceae bacterium]
MRMSFILLGLLFGLTGCISLGGGGEPSKTTVVVPPGSSTTCVNSDGTPCKPNY